MNKKNILIYFILCLIIAILLVNNTKTDNFECVRQVNTTNNGEKKIDISDYHKYKILAYYPQTEFDILNDNISKKINDYIKKFKEEIKYVDVQLNQYYTLNIFYNTYEYESYISYIFYIEYYTGGAHPNHEIYTVVYDKSQNKIIDINDLIKINPNTLNIFSSISRKNLLQNKNIVDTSMMIDGTVPNIENFSNFVFSKDGIIIFFNYYQVAPYSSGQFEVIIPYEEIFKN